MKYNRFVFILPLLIVAFVVLSCNNKQTEKTEIAQIRESPKEAKKCIITSFYEAITNDGVQICGQEINDAMHYRDTVYYDIFNNIILIKEHDFSTIKCEYYSAENGKIKKKSTIQRGKIEYIDYIRNQKGLIIETKVSGDIIDIDRGTNTTYKYDNNDVRIEENDLTNNKKTIIKTSPSSKDKIIKTYQVIRNDVEYYHNHIKGLVEQGTEIYDSKTNTLDRQLIEKYNYGQTDRIEDNVFTYDKSGKLLTEIYSGESSGSWVSLPEGLKGEELDKYIIEHYYGANLILKPLDIRKVESIYNSKGDLTDYNTYNLVNGIYQLSFPNKYEYEYNDKGDWIKKIMYGFTNLICIREIAYY